MNIELDLRLCQLRRVLERDPAVFRPQQPL
jgi:hypothetical protein